MKIILVSSSIRAKRNSHRIALLLQREICNIAGYESSIIDLRDENIPLFCERFSDMSHPPAALRVISEKIRAADGIILITPEHNGSICAALKSMIDIYGSSEFADKPIGVAAVSTGIFGGIRAAQNLQQIILAINAYPFPRMLLTNEVIKQVDEAGNILNPGFEEKVETFLIPFLRFVGKIQRHSHIYEER